VWRVIGAIVCPIPFLIDVALARAARRQSTIVTTNPVEG